MTENPFSQMNQSVLPGVQVPFVVGRRSELAAQFELIRDEFSGKSELGYDLAKTIIRIRRELDLKADVARFFEILNHDTSGLVKSLSTRWLVSVCDTIADHGNAQHRAGAICVSTFVNLVKLAETERLMCSNPTSDEAAYLERWPHDLGNGVSSYHLRKGDMPRNLISRIRRCLHDVPLIEQVFDEIVLRYQETDNLLSRLAKHNPEFWDRR